MGGRALGFINKVKLPATWMEMPIDYPDAVDRAGVLRLGRSPTLRMTATRICMNPSTRGGACATQFRWLRFAGGDVGGFGRFDGVFVELVDVLAIALLDHAAFELESGRKAAVGNRKFIGHEQNLL